MSSGQVPVHAGGQQGVCLCWLLAVAAAQQQLTTACDMHIVQLYMVQLELQTPCMGWVLPVVFMERTTGDLHAVSTLHNGLSRPSCRMSWFACTYGCLVHAAVATRAHATCCGY